MFLVATSEDAGVLLHLVGERSGMLPNIFSVQDSFPSKELRAQMCAVQWWRSLAGGTVCGRKRIVGVGRGLLGVTRALPAPQGWLWISGMIATRRARCLEFKYLETVIGKAH